MRTTFRPRSSTYAPSKKRLIYIALSLLLGILVFSLFRSPVLSTAKQVFTGENAISRGLGNLTNFLRSKDTLLAENESLREKVASYESLQTSYRAMENSRDTLLERFGREPAGPGIAAGVLARPPQMPYDLLLIDVGEENGVRLGDRVHLPEGGALGFVVETQKAASKLTLYSGSGVETNAILERADVPIVLRGQGSGTMRFTLPRSIAVEAGDRILLPGLKSELVAVVVEVDMTPTDSEKRVLARSVANIEGVRFVIIR